MPYNVRLTLVTAYVLFIIGLIFIIGPARGHDIDHPELNAWYDQLRQPNNPAVSCCGKSDAYWCDILTTESKVGDDGKTDVRNFCTITDERDDVPLKRPHVDVGTRIEIPELKIKWGPHDMQSSDTSVERNPTGHSIVFLSATSRGQFVYCFIMGILG